MADPLIHASAYKQLRPGERSYVDGYVRTLERDCARAGERISNALYRSIPDDVTAASRGMLDKPLVRAAIVERINTLAADSELTVHRVVKELMAMGFASLGDYMEVDEGGAITFDFAKATPEQMAAVKSYEMEWTRNGPKQKIVLHDKLGSLKMLADFMGMLQPDNPMWAATQARPVQTTIQRDATVESAGDRYARAIEG